ncbi:MAG: hypothetical protein H7A33_04685 [Deltaproteobacteria bacterium]|nr:hypothetical protein [Deltaproteobacteria bacterium]
MVEHSAFDAKQISQVQAPFVDTFLSLFARENDAYLQAAIASNHDLATAVSEIPKQPTNLPTRWTDVWQDSAARASSYTGIAGGAMAIVIGGFFAFVFNENTLLATVSSIIGSGSGALIPLALAFGFKKKYLAAAAIPAVLMGMLSSLACVSALGSSEPIAALVLVAVVFGSGIFSGVLAGVNGARGKMRENLEDRAQILEDWKVKRARLVVDQMQENHALQREFILRVFLNDLAVQKLFLESQLVPDVDETIASLSNQISQTQEQSDKGLLQTQKERFVTLSDLIGALQREVDLQIENEFGNLQSLDDLIVRIAIAQRDGAKITQENKECVEMLGLVLDLATGLRERRAMQGLIPKVQQRS